MIKQLLCIYILAAFTAISQSINITVDATKNLHSISPWIYGRNNNTEGTSADWKIYNDANLRMYRENGGNNTTKYNWTNGLCSHPDWYNNVYNDSWDVSANAFLSKSNKNAQILYGIPILGMVASNTKNNFDDWSYNSSQWWSGTSNNWAGGGGPTTGNGDPNKYLKNWPADSAVGIFDYWFKKKGFDPNRFMYWNMDNEPEVWKGTHDDIATSAITAEDYMQKYFAFAKAARAKFPNVKLLGPVSTNEWQWYHWNDDIVTDKNNKTYTWLEYFIKRIAEEQKASGIRLLDVLDVHFYPGSANNPEITLQLHKLWFDTQWSYPLANGSKSLDLGGWNEDSTKEFLFERCNRWLNKYVGLNHGVNFSLSEYGAIGNDNTDANVIACWYATHLGEFANHNVELFTPWDWYKGQWEVLSLFSNYYGQYSTATTSSNSDKVAAFSSLSSDGDSLMIVLVNKDQTNTQTANISLNHFTPSATTVGGFQLSDLGSTETYVSKVNNALKTKSFTISGTSISTSLPKLSVTMIRIPTAQPIATEVDDDQLSSKVYELYPNPCRDKIFLDDRFAGYKACIQDIYGRTLQYPIEVGSHKYIDVSMLQRGNYIINFSNDSDFVIHKIAKE